jgi:hypothetical protein
MIDYKTALGIVIEDLGGEITIQKDAFKEHHVLHYFEDEKEIVIVSEIIEKVE